MHRFFVPPEWLKRDTVQISGALAHQLRHVLRLSRGDSFILLDNSGWEYEVIIGRIEDHQITVMVQERRPSSGEPRTKVTLYQGYLKGTKLEFVLQKGTEIGIATFVPILCERCVAIPASRDTRTKLERWQKILQEAAEQSGRGRIPELRPTISFSEACSSIDGLSLLPWEGERVTGMRRVLQDIPKPSSVNIFIGPEGGFTVEELEQAKKHGIRPVTLGPRTLRAETAGLVAASLVLYEYGEL